MHRNVQIVAIVAAVLGLILVTHGMDERNDDQTIPWGRDALPPPASDGRPLRSDPPTAAPPLKNQRPFVTPAAKTTPPEIAPELVQKLRPVK